MDKFYTTQEVERLLGKSRMTVARLAKKENWQIQKVKDNGTIKNVYLKADVDAYLAPVTLEDTSKTRTVALPEYKQVDELPTWNQQIAWSRYCLCIALEKAYEEELGQKAFIIEKFVENAEEEFPEFMKHIKKLSIKTLQRWYGIYRKNKENPLALATGYGKSRGLRKMTPEIADMAKALYLTKNKLSMKEVCVRIREQYGIDAVSYGVIRNYLKKDISSLTKDYGRMNDKEFKDTHIPYILRDYSLLKPNDIWVSDGHDVEFQCYHPFRKNKDGSRYYGSPKWILWMDVKSRLITGWTISWEEDTESIAMALKNGIQKWGRPKAIYTDNGRAYKGKILKGTDETDGIYTSLGITKEKQRHANPYNAQAKNIERMFVDFKKSFATRFLTYKGGNIIERPDTMRKIAKNKDLQNMIFEQEDIEALIAGFVDYKNETYYVLRGEGHRGHGMNGRYPLQVMEEELPENQRFMIPEERLRILFLYEEVRTIGQNGITFLENIYEDEKLYLHLKEKVRIKYDPNDLKYMYVYLMTGEFLCKATLLSHEAWDTVHQYKTAARKKRKISKLVREEMELKSELSNIKTIQYIEETTERVEIIENLKKISEKKKEKSIKVGGFEIPID